MKHCAECQKNIVENIKKCAIYRVDIKIHRPSSNPQPRPEIFDNQPANRYLYFCSRKCIAKWRLPLEENEVD